MLRVTKIYKWMIVALGATTLAYSGYWLPTPRFDWRLLMLTGVMIFVSSKLSVQIPRVNTNVTVSDTFIFLVLLVYGGLRACCWPLLTAFSEVCAFAVIGSPFFSTAA